MRIIIQRVSRASVSINEVIHSQIYQGFLILVGVSHADTEEDVEWLTQKILNLRVFNDVEGKMNRSIKDVCGELLIVSQFTLFASIKKGNRPSFIASARPEIAVPIYELFVNQLKQSALNVQTGIFGADMQINLVNDGPVTIVMDSKNKE